jgi:hypothetical protein
MPFQGAGHVSTFHARKLEQRVYNCQAGKKLKRLRHHDHLLAFIGFPIIGPNTNALGPLRAVVGIDLLYIPDAQMKPGGPLATNVAAMPAANPFSDGDGGFGISNFVGRKWLIDDRTGG